MNSWREDEVKVPVSYYEERKRNEKSTQKKWSSLMFTAG